MGKDRKYFFEIRRRPTDKERQSKSMKLFVFSNTHGTDDPADAHPVANYIVVAEDYFMAAHALQRSFSIERAGAGVTSGWQHVRTYDLALDLVIGLHI